MITSRDPDIWLSRQSGGPFPDLPERARCDPCESNVAAFPWAIPAFPSPQLPTPSTLRSNLRTIKPQDVASPLRCTDALNLSVVRAKHYRPRWELGSLRPAP